MQTTASTLPNTRMRTWDEEVNMLLTLLDCVLFDGEAVYASSEFTTGKRFYELCRQNNVRSGEELKQRLGPQYSTQLLHPNKEEGIRFGQKVRSFGHDIVLTPNPFVAPQWTQSEYLGFWEQVIRKKCRVVYFNKGWEFSNGCTFEYLVGVKAGIPLFDYKKNPLLIRTAKELIAEAIANLENDNFSVPKLRDVWREIDSF